MSRCRGGGEWTQLGAKDKVRSLRVGAKERTLDEESGWVVRVLWSQGGERQGKGGQLMGVKDPWSNRFRGSELERQEVMGRQ